MSLCQRQVIAITQCRFANHLKSHRSINSTTRYAALARVGSKTFGAKHE
jgi:hypothetical protein